MAIYRLLPSFAFLFILLLPLKGLQGKSGLYVHGPGLYLHSGAQLSVQGDVYLEEAEIGGSGQLLLSGAFPQAVHACGSRVARLSVDNPTTVALYGELRVTTVLSVQRGVLDVRAGQLVLEENAVLKCAAGAQVLGHVPLAVSPAAPPVGTFLPRIYRSSALLQPVPLPLAYTMQPARRALPAGRLAAAGIDLPVPHPPPRPVPVA